MVLGQPRSYIRVNDEGPGMASHNQYQLFETTAGVAAIGWKGAAVTSLRLPAPDASETERSVLRRLPGAARAEPPADIAAVIDAAIRYFDGERTEFFEVPVDPGQQPPFFTQVYAFIRTLGWGETTTYGAVARALEAGPEHARAVGQAMATNPVPLIIPCHRVLAAGGKIGGFSAPGGSTSKARMLELEGVPLAPVQQGFDF
jgi:methylated-DNA-[protein]-cysteine S-methyltransferase